MTEDTKISLVYSRRKTLSMEIKPDGILYIKAPKGISEREIRDFVKKHEGWIDSHLKKLEEEKARLEGNKKLTKEEIRDLADRACIVIPERVKHYAPLIGVTCGRITVRNQKTRWGSCSSKGNLNFNCLLMLTPPEVIDSVVVHELCHLKQMNHSKRFYAEILKVYPDYYKWNKWLKDNGSAVLARL